MLFYRCFFVLVDKSQFNVVLCGCGLQKVSEIMKKIITVKGRFGSILLLFTRCKRLLNKRFSVFVDIKHLKFVNIVVKFTNVKYNKICKNVTKRKF